MTDNERVGLVLMEAMKLLKAYGLRLELSSDPCNPDGADMVFVADYQGREIAYETTYGNLDNPVQFAAMCETLVKAAKDKLHGEIVDGMTLSQRLRREIRGCHDHR